MAWEMYNGVSKISQPGHLHKSKDLVQRSSPANISISPTAVHQRNKISGCAKNGIKNIFWKTV